MCSARLCRAIHRGFACGRWAYSHSVCVCGWVDVCVSECLCVCVGGGITYHISHACSLMHGSGSHRQMVGAACLLGRGLL